jgi:uncharacterized protein (DUF1778 family)
LAASREKLQIWVFKGDKARLELAARAAGVSVTQFIVVAVNAYAGEDVLTPSSVPASRGME